MTSVHFNGLGFDLEKKQTKNPGGFFLIGIFSKISMQYLFRLSNEKKIYGVGLGQESKPTLAFYDISY